jgi:hypothetical protein
MNRVLSALLVIFYFSSAQEVNSQFQVNGHFDLGNNNLSDGIFLHLSGLGSYDEQHWGARAGFQLGLVQPQDVFFNSWFLSSYGKIPAGDLKIVVGGEYLWTSFSPDLREINWILFAGTTLRHWHFNLGNNSRIYRLSNKASDEYWESGEGRITEPWNMMYTVNYAVKPFGNRWNLMFALTNYDIFIIQQETNPMINTRFEYSITAPLQLFSELWYKSAGLLNDQVNYFSTYIRIGIIWDISSE